MLKNIGEFFVAHFDFKFYKTAWIALAFGLAIIPSLIFMPQEWGFENGVIENVQLIVLFFMVLQMSVKVVDINHLV